MATKMSANPKYGMPSHRKLAARTAGWLAWRRGMQMLRLVHAEIHPKLNAQHATDQKYDNIAAVS
jgi:hypothetical protein